MNARTSWRWAVLTLFVAASGCGGSGLVNVSGRLTYKGQPVPSTRVMFQPEDGGREIHGVTDDNGDFTLKYSRTQTAIPAGRHTVYLRYIASTEEEQHEIPPKASKELKAILEKYKDPATSDLHYEITTNGQFLDIQLR
jgi:hypothetical protein